MALFSHVRLLHLSINVAQICKDAGEPLFLGGLEVLLVFCTLWTGPASYQNMSDLMHTYTCHLTWSCRSNINNSTGWHVVSRHMYEIPICNMTHACWSLEVHLALSSGLTELPHSYLHYNVIIIAISPIICTYEDFRESRHHALNLFRFPEVWLLWKKNSASSWLVSVASWWSRVLKWAASKPPWFVWREGLVMQVPMQYYHRLMNDWPLRWLESLLTGSLCEPICRKCFSM